jgi:hypothetical protein
MLTSAKHDRSTTNGHIYRYIKELADRLNTLEGAMQSGEIPQFGPLHHESASRRGSNEYSPPPNIDVSQQRKRTFSTISSDFSPLYQPQRPSVGWAPPEPSRHLPPPASVYQISPPVSAEQSQHLFRPTHYSPNGLAPQPTWRKASDSAIRPGSFEQIAQAEQIQADLNVEWDDSIIDEYGYIHLGTMFKHSRLLDTTRIFIPRYQSFLTLGIGLVPVYRTAHPR